MVAALLAGLTGYAVRTGPPVPSYFLLGVFMVAPAIGIALLAMSTRLLWVTVVASVVLVALALARHKYAMAHGLEEAEPDEEAAKQADLERAEKLGEGLDKKPPI